MVRISSLLVLLFSVFVLTGCATSLTNGAPAKTFDAGKGQVATGYQFDVHTQAFSGVYRAARSTMEIIEEGNGEEIISGEYFRTLLDAVLMWQLFPYGGTPELMGRIGVYDGLLHGADVGFRFNGNVYKGDVRLQIWESLNGSDAVSLQFGYGRHRSVVHNIFEWVGLAEWNRQDFDFQINWGREVGNWAKIYLSPRYLVSRIETSVDLAESLRRRLPEQYRDWDPGDLFETSHLHYVGLNWGTMLGYRWLYATIDVSMFHVLFRPTVLGSQRDYDGWVVAPTVGLTVMWD